MTIKAIETTYKGYRFRSRLEARWAVFFDYLQVDWVYEPEGFELGGGVRYLPDFHIGQYAPGQHTYGPWIEIKGVKPSKDEIKRMGDLCDAGATYGLILWGLPGEEEWLHFHKEGHVDDDSDMPCIGHWIEYLFDCRDRVRSQREIDRAIDKARSARFEFGQSGARA